MILKRAFYWYKLKWNEVSGFWGYFVIGRIYYLIIYRGKCFIIVFVCKGWMFIYKVKAIEVIYKK